MPMPFWFWETTVGRAINLLRYRSISSQRRDGTTCQEPPFPEDRGRLESRRLGSLEHELAAGSIILSWDGDMDPTHPQNWSKKCKIMVTVIISLYSFIVYCGSSICIMSYEPIMIRFGHSREVVSLILSLYVVGYGVGPMLFSPLSEIPRVGRNPPYVLSFLLFVVVSILLGVVDNFPAIATLRFLQGFFGSPCLATAGASIGDVYPPDLVPYGLTLWVVCINCGPALGPLFATHAVALDWRWPFWQIICMAAPFLLLLICLLPETLPDTILIRRAQLLRRQKGITNIYAPSEVEPWGLWDSIGNSIIKPVEISMKDPAIGFTCLYTSFVYSIYYSFFEAFPLIYTEGYHMSPAQFSLIFLALVVGCGVGAFLYLMYLYYYHPQRHQSANQASSTQESILIPALLGSFLTPTGLFLFAWTARATIHWSIPTIGIVIYSASSFGIYQALLIYIPRSYPKYAASLFAANDLVRSTTAAVFIMVTPYMYNNLGVPKGVALLASVSVLGIVGMAFLYLYGERMRARSRFAT